MIYRDAIVGAATEARQRTISECSVEWYAVGQIRRGGSYVARQLTDLRVRLNGTMLGIVRIRPLWLLTVGLYRTGGYDPPLQFRCGAVGIRPTRFIILGLYRTGGW